MSDFSERLIAKLMAVNFAFQDGKEKDEAMISHVCDTAIAIANCSTLQLMDACLMAVSIFNGVCRDLAGAREMDCSMRDGRTVTFRFKDTVFR